MEEFQWHIVWRGRTGWWLAEKKRIKLQREVEFPPPPKPACDLEEERYPEYILILNLGNVEAHGEGRRERKRERGMREERCEYAL